jgi:aminoglycoside 6'-N-acetyltransferase I
MEIVNMQTLTQTQRTQAAQMLTDELPLGWPMLSDAEAEVNKRWCGEPNALFLAAVDDGVVVGWCGILPHYDGNVFELHPLVVRRDKQRKGIGAALVNEIEAAARERGGLTIWVGTDDEKPDGETSFAKEVWEPFGRDPLCLKRYSLHFLASLFTTRFPGLTDGSVLRPLYVVADSGDKLFMPEYIRPFPTSFLPVIFVVAHGLAIW